MIVTVRQMDQWKGTICISSICVFTEVFGEIVPHADIDDIKVLRRPGVGFLKHADEFPVVSIRWLAPGVMKKKKDIGHYVSNVP